MNIAIAAFADIPDGGAVANRILMLSSGLAALKHQVHIVVPFKFHPGPLTEIISGVKIHWGAQAKPAEAFYWMGRLRKRILLFRMIRKLLVSGLDWLILYDMGVDGVPLWLLAKRYRCLVASENCDIRVLSRRTTLWELLYIASYHLGHYIVTPLMDVNFAISNYLENYLAKIAPRVPRLILPAPVDTSEFIVPQDVANNFRNRWGINNSLTIGYFGSTMQAKGLEVLLKAAKRLADQGDDFRLLITGKAANHDGLRTMITELALGEKVILTGYLSRDDLIGTMAAADILVEPKIDHKQNQAAFPQKLAEYLATGKAVVASAIGDIPQYLSDRDNALLCRPGDEDSMAVALKTLLDDQRLRAKLGLRGRETARNYFDHKIIARRMIRLLARIKSKEDFAIISYDK